METVGDYVYEKKDLIGHGAFAIVFKGNLREVCCEIKVEFTSNI